MQELVGPVTFSTMPPILHPVLLIGWDMLAALNSSHISFHIFAAINEMGIYVLDRPVTPPTITTSLFSFQMNLPLHIYSSNPLAKQS